MLIRITTAIVAMLPTGGFALAQKPPLIQSIQCDKFSRVLDGWRSAKDATLGGRPFKNKTFDRGKVIIDGQDVAGLLDKKCGRPEQ